MINALYQRVSVIRRVKALIAPFLDVHFLYGISQVLAGDLFKVLDKSVEVTIRYFSI